MENIVVKYLADLDIPIAKKYCKKLIASHPDYPSMLSWNCNKKVDSELRVIMRPVAVGLLIILRFVQGCGNPGLNAGAC
ncbi:hypothetical protein, partial [Fodinibius salsisoli]